ncbi:hypothetical protein [Nocardiopsis sp. NRRL B-16309]|uniref:hypothetical protein n=1 Tax=Nocardiopsis sp. NRRL B-16309 TaxID=1519494 RepID=UPI0006ADB120|nr:hypothetical protein [Nocardiopsis sp. NRRL B-16309]KOX16005.1 hypothetical protein ADL05_13555 [Nocardiopsis sp. NRRL B-16309]
MIPVPAPVTVRTDRQEVLGGLVGPRLVLAAGDSFPDTGGIVGVGAPGNGCAGRVVWHGADGAALITVDGDLPRPGPTRWGVLPEGRRTPCTVLTGDGAVRTTVEPAQDVPDRFSVDARDTGADITGAPVVCGDMVLGVVLSGPSHRVLPLTALPAVPAARAVLDHHGVSGRAEPIGTAIPAESGLPRDLAVQRLHGIATSPPPSGPAEFARLTDTCLGLATALTTDVVEAADSVASPGPLHAALDRLAADPETPVEVFVHLFTAEVRGLRAWKAAFCAIAARRFADEAGRPRARLRAGAVVNAHRLAARALAGEERFAAVSDTLAELRVFLEGLPDDEHDAHRSAEIAALGHHALTLMRKDRSLEAAETYGVLAMACKAAVERGVGDHRSEFVGALSARAAMLMLLGLPAEALKCVSSAVRVGEKLREIDPGSVSEALGDAHGQRAILLRSLGRTAEAEASEALAAEVAGPRPEGPADPTEMVMLLGSRAKEHTVAGRHAEAAETLAEAVRYVPAGDQADEIDRRTLGILLSARAEALVRAGRPQEAREVAARAAEAGRRPGAPGAGPAAGR